MKYSVTVNHNGVGQFRSFGEAIRYAAIHMKLQDTAYYACVESSDGNMSIDIFKRFGNAGVKLEIDVWCQDNVTANRRSNQISKQLLLMDMQLFVISKNPPPLTDLLPMSADEMLPAVIDETVIAAAQAVFNEAIDDTCIGIWDREPLEPLEHGQDYFEPTWISDGNGGSILSETGKRIHDAYLKKYGRQ